jgi:hydroxysqualene dehydroxylase
VPSETRPIVNAHFRIEGAFDLAGGAPFLGIVGGTAHWLFRRGEVVSVTVSAAGALVEESNERLAAAIWRDVARAIARPEMAMPAYRIIKEKRATIAQTPQQDALRPPMATRWRNLLLAGDWTATGLPATIEGAVRSGRAAAERIAGGLGDRVRGDRPEGQKK